MYRLKRPPLTSMYYRIRRHVVYIPGKESVEAWGIDRPAPNLDTTTARFTDICDPLGSPCSLLLLLQGQYVTWDRFWEWLSYAETKGYTLATTLDKISPYSTIIITD